MPKDNDYMRRYRKRRTANSEKSIGRAQKNQFSMPEKVEGTRAEQAKIYEQINSAYKG